MIIKWYPRSWIQITSANLSICFDPSFLISNYKKHEYITLSDNEDDYLPIGAVQCNYIFLTHTHKDHYKFETLNRIAHNKSLVISPEMINELYIERTVLVKPGEKLTYPGLKIDVVPSYNCENGSSTKKVHKRDKCVGYIINIEGKRLYISGDTDYIPEMDSFKQIDIAFLPIGGTFTMNKEEVIQCLKVLKPNIFIPVHHLLENPESLVGMMPRQTELIIPIKNKEIKI